MKVTLYLIGDSEDEAVLSLDLYDSYTEAKHRAIRDRTKLFSVCAEVDFNSIEFVRDFTYPIRSINDV